MRTVTATFEDGTSHRYQGVPDEATPAQVLARLAQEFPGKQVVKLDGGKAAQTPADWQGIAGLMPADEQKAGWEQYQAGRTLPGDKLDPVPAPAPAPYAERIPAQLQAMNATPPAAPAMDLSGAGPGGEGGGAPADTRGTGSPLAQMDRQTAYGLGGALAGTLGGLFTPVPGAAFVGGGLGSAVGTYIGAYQDAKAKGLSDDMAADEATTATGIDIAFTAGGGLALKVAGKVVGTLAKVTPGVQALLKRIGFKPRLSVPDDELLAGKKVFEQSTPADLQRTMKSGAERVVGQSGVDLTPRVLSGTESFTEAAARSGNRVAFERGAQRQEDALAKELIDARDALRDGAPRAGAALQQGLDLAERKVKDTFGPVFEKISQTLGKGTEIVDIRGMIGQARAILKAEAGQSIKTLTPAERSLLENVAGGRGFVSPAEAHAIQSAFGQRVRDMASSTDMDSALRARLAEFASSARSALDNAFERAVNSGMMKPEDLALVRQAREMYREMATTLYDPALRRARGATEERAAGVIGQVGDSERVDAMTRLLAFGEKVDNLQPAVSGARPAAAAAAESASRAVVPARPVAGASTNLPVPAGVRNTNDLARLVRVGENPGVAAEDLNRVASDLGMAPSAGQSARDLFDAAIRDVRATFFAKHMGTPELMANFAKKAQGEDYQRTLRALFPNDAERLTIERMSQVAQLLQRTSTDSTGIRVVAGQIGQALGGITGRVAGTLTAGVLPKLLAKAYMTPALRPDLPRVAAWLLNAAQKGAPAAANEVPAFVQAFMDQDVSDVK